MKKRNIILALVLTGGAAMAMAATDPFEEKKVYLNSQAGKAVASSEIKATKGTVRVDTTLNIRSGAW
ncbi:MAG TPA: hypothetical protein PLM07_19215, partial [Candidatus Rifleibacterium sp.]|nr:hypothetical protein [Candidatus Rifleibacterium sp.]